MGVSPEGGVKQKTFALKTSERNFT